VLLIAERRKGVLRRLAATRVSHSSIICGKLAARVALRAIPVAVAMVALRDWFGLDWGPHLWAVLVLLLAYITLCSTLAVAFASVARTESQELAGRGIGSAPAA